MNKLNLTKWKDNHTNRKQPYSYMYSELVVDYFKQQGFEKFAEKDLPKRGIFSAYKTDKDEYLSVSYEISKDDCDELEPHITEKEYQYLISLEKSLNRSLHTIQFWNNKVSKNRIMELTFYSCTADVEYLSRTINLTENDFINFKDKDYTLLRYYIVEGWE